MDIFFYFQEETRAEWTEGNVACRLSSLEPQPGFRCDRKRRWLQQACSQCVRVCACVRACVSARAHLCLSSSVLMLVSLINISTSLIKERAIKKKITNYSLMAFFLLLMIVDHSRFCSDWSILGSCLTMTFDLRY